jgi:archaellum component FlaG (FlaF/FlaG flagellin family)
MHMSFMRMFAAALVLSASVAGVACQAQESKGEEKKAEQPAKAAPTVYKVGIDGAT